MRKAAVVVAWVMLDSFSESLAGRLRAEAGPHGIQVRPRLRFAAEPVAGDGELLNRDAPVKLHGHTDGREWTE